LALEGIEAGYRDAPVLRGVSLAIAPGEVVGLVGPNGSGKSTLLRVAAGVLRPRRGRVVLEGAPMAALRRREVARLLAWLPQSEGTDLSFSVREVVALGRLPHLGAFEPPGDRDREAVARAIDATRIAALADRAFPELSEGEKQRVLLARCLAQEPRVLLLDEPTARLDVRQAWALMEVVRARAAEGVAALAAIHDLALAARFCDRVLVLREGLIASGGPPERALSEGTLAAAFGMHARLERDGATVAFTLLGRSE
jgi:iron complex transport system ATP-binding protein